jgi:hypothetical protein
MHRALRLSKDRAQSGHVHQHAFCSSLVKASVFRAEFGRRGCTPPSVWYGLVLFIDRSDLYI